MMRTAFLLLVAATVPMDRTTCIARMISKSLVVEALTSKIFCTQPAVAALMKVVYIHIIAVCSRIVVIVAVVVLVEAMSQMLRFDRVAAVVWTGRRFEVLVEAMKQKPRFDRVAAVVWIGRRFDRVVAVVWTGRRFDRVAAVVWIGRTECERAEVGVLIVMFRRIQH